MRAALRRATPTRGLSLIETAILVAALCLAGSVAVYTVIHFRERSRAAECRLRLAMYGQALGLYAEDFGVFPYENVGREAGRSPYIPRP